MAAPRILILLTTAVLAVAACSPAAAAPAVPAAPGSAVPNGGTASSPAGVTVGTATSQGFGTVLTGPDGKTLYTHAGDSATSSTCTGACATAWPPLAATGQPAAGAGVTGQLGTATRADGTIQVTYDGLPLYYWQGDAKAGDVTGNGVEGFSVATVGGAGSMPQPSVAAPASSAPGKYGY